MSLNFGQIPSMTTELTALDHLKKKSFNRFSLHFLFRSFYYLQITRTGITSWVFEFIPDHCLKFRVTCLWASLLMCLQSSCWLSNERSLPIGQLVLKFGQSLRLCFWLNEGALNSCGLGIDHRRKMSTPKWNSLGGKDNSSGLSMSGIYNIGHRVMT